MLDKKKVSVNTKVENFIFRNRKAIIAVVSIAIVAAVAICVVVGINDSKAKKGLISIDKIEYEYTAKSINLSDSDILARQEKALADVTPFCKKTGIVGVRANMLFADVSFAKKDYSSALTSYLEAEKKGPKSYTAAICKYNAAICYEELGNIEEAVKAFSEVAEAKDFYLASHALFNAARLKETLGLFNEASEIYQKAVDNYDNDIWANLSNSRLIDLQSKGKVE